MGNCSWAADRGFRGFRPLELVAMILGFVFFWPLGLAILVFKLCGGHFPRLAGPQWQGGSWGGNQGGNQGGGSYGGGQPANDPWATPGVGGSSEEPPF